MFRPILLSLLMLQGDSVPRPSLNVYVAEAVMRQWSLMYREFKTEFSQCLYGPMIEDSTGRNLHVILAVNMDIRPSQSQIDRVAAVPDDSGAINLEDLCPWRFSNWVFLGVAHQHRRDNPDDPDGEDPCFLGTNDARTMEQGRYALTAIVCGLGKYVVYPEGSGWTGLACIFDPEAPGITCQARREDL